MRKDRKIALSQLLETDYARILTYPTSNLEDAMSRITELSAMGVSALRFNGVTLIDGIPVLGKGCIGIVTKADLHGEIVALKIRRSDADRPSMNNEARLLRLANSVEVGPRLITATRNFLAMELFNGIPLFRWAQRSSPSRDAVRHVIARLLRDCFSLDSIGLDHGELSHAPKNVLVSQSSQPCIVDFETASITRRPANVTSLMQYFIFGGISANLHTSKIFPERGKIVKALSEYKQQGSVESFQHLVKVLRLQGKLL